MNTTIRTWAPNWTEVDQGSGMIAKKESDTDGLFAEFRDKAGKLVTVHIGDGDFPAFGEASNGGKQAHGERVLRAILETYVEKIGDPPSDINAKDLGSHLYPLQLQFRQDLGEP